jgi:hypothetical protein
MRGLLVWTAGLLVVCSPALGAKAARPEAAALEPADRELVIREAYARLSRGTTESRGEAAFEVTSWRHLEAADFASTRWVDLVTLSGGETIDVNHEPAAQGPPGKVAFGLRWRREEVDTTELAELDGLDDVTVEAALAAARRHNGLTDEVVAITAYEVTASFAGKSRSYAAAALWFPGPTRSRAAVVFVDLVTEGVERALVEAAPQPAAGHSGLVSGTEPLSTCAAETIVDRDFWDSDVGRDGHRTGDHSARASVEWTCSCDIACTSRVSGQLFTTPTCNDWGLKYQFPGGVFTVHKMAYDYKFPSNVVYNATTTGASSKGGFLCAMQVCPYGICNLTVSVGVTPAGPTFSVGYSTNPVNPSWARSHEFAITCPRCEPYTPPAGDDPEIYDDYWYDTGGGGGYYRVPNGNGTYSCCWMSSPGSPCNWMPC